MLLDSIEWTVEWKNECHIKEFYKAVYEEQEKCLFELNTVAYFGQMKPVGLIFWSFMYLILSMYIDLNVYWVPQKLPQVYTVIVYICIGKVAGFEVYICANIWNA